MAAAAQCTDEQDNCATSGSACSPWLSGELACNAADAGHFLLNGVVQPCSAVAGAASVTCDEEGNSRATCSTGYQKTDNTADAASDTCTQCTSQGAGCTTDNAHCLATGSSLRCDTAAAGFYLDDGTLAECEAVANAASVTCAGAANSRAACGAGFYRTDRTGLAVSDVCSECAPQAAGCSSHDASACVGQSQECTAAAPGFFLVAGVATGESRLPFCARLPFP